jgi:pyruvate/2-oxoglutarate dehydrogenase complex dihydrolipoamide dehydrogenase (E3) component
MVSYDYDIIVIGGGSAGSTAAKFAAKRDLKVALIERDKLGGTCLNYGCDPTKAFLHAARNLKDRELQEPLQEEWGHVVIRVRELIDEIRGGSHDDAVQRQSNRGIDVILGQARFVDPHTLTVGEKTISAEKILVATGMEPAVPPIDGLDKIKYLTNREAVSLDSLPVSIAIIGGGFIGVEFSQIFRRFGVDVTILELAPRILMKADGEVSDALQQSLEDEGIRFILNTDIQRVDQDKNGIRVSYVKDDKAQSITVESLLVATGRRPALDELSIEKAGLEIEEGSLKVESTLQTNVPHIYAAGDVSGYPPFTHVAAPQGQMAVFNAFCSSEPMRFDDTAIPAAVFTDPSMAYVGMTEESLKESDQAYDVRTINIGGLPRNKIEQTEKGIVKILIRPEGEIAGVHVFSTNADECIGPAVLAMRHGLNVDQLGDLMLPYPSRSQGLSIAANRFSTTMQDRCPDFPDE